MRVLKCWIEAMRLRTLPVSVAGVFMAVALALLNDVFSAVPALLCLGVAVAAQISSNFANEYYDFKGGLDRKGREGPRRGVTEGDITPRAMLVATFVTLGIACSLGLLLIAYSGWWLIAVGLAVALGVFAYSTGPYPLSHHGLGEAAVVVFFGLVPVNFTYYLMSGHWPLTVVCASIAIGLMGANVLIVNNYRDRDDDLAVGKRTLAVRYGLGAMRGLYLLNGLVALALMAPVWRVSVVCGAIPGMVYLASLVMSWRRLREWRGARLNALLGMTSMSMLLFSLLTLILSVFSR